MLTEVPTPTRHSGRPFARKRRGDTIGDMPSRKARKRYRRKLAEATAGESPTLRQRKLSGGWGRGLRNRRGDWRLVCRAANQDWPTPQAVRHAVVADWEADFAAARSDRDTRLVLSMAWAAIAMDGANLRAEQAERRAAARERRRAQ